MPTFFEQTIENQSKTASFIHEIKCPARIQHIVLLLSQFENKKEIANQLFRRTIDSLLSLECFYSKTIKVLGRHSVEWVPNTRLVCFFLNL